MNREFAMNIMGIKTEGLGTNNQMRGIIIAGIEYAKKRKKTPVSRNALLEASDGTLLHPGNFLTQKSFEQAVQSSIDAYLSKNAAPEFVVLPFDISKSESENKDVDILSASVKKAFATHGHTVGTMVMTSNLYDYQNVDLTHVCNHLLSAEDEKILHENHKLKNKVVETLGVPSNINWTFIRNHINKLQTTFEVLNKSQSAILNRNKKTILFSLGGITDNGAIDFDLKDAENLMNIAIKFKAKNYNIIFTNSPRTPSDVTDYLYEKCQLFHMEFYNSKKIAENEEEVRNFRNYSGKYKSEFEEQAKTIGNIYPGVLALCEFVVNTHDSFSYTSDAAALGLPSVVYNGNFIDKEKRPDCYKLFDLCHKKGYVLSLDEAVEKIENGQKIETKKMDSVSFQLVKAINCFLSKSRCISKTDDLKR